MTSAAADEANKPHSPANSSVGVIQEKRHALSIWNRPKSAFSKRRLVILFAILGSLIAVALALGLGLGLGLHPAPKSTPLHPIVDLGYAKYQGSNSSGVSQWLGMRYAAVPTGQLRFAAPEPPTKQKGVQSAAQVWRPSVLHRITLIFHTSTAIDA